MRRPAPLLLLGSALLLAACSEEPENIQMKAENMSRMLGNKAAELEAEASNGVDAAVAPLENEAAALLDEAAANAADPAADGAGNTAR